MFILTLITNPQATVPHAVMYKMLPAETKRMNVVTGLSQAVHLQSS